MILKKTFMAFGFVLILRMCFFSGVRREWKIYFYVYRKSTQAITKTFDLKVDISKCNRVSASGGVYCDRQCFNYKP